MSTFPASSSRRSLHPAALNASTTAVGAIVLGTVAVASGETLALPTDPKSWAAVSYLALVGSVGAFLIYFSLLRTWHSTSVSLFAVFTPAIAVALGAMFLGEQLSLWSGIGTALILVGVALTLVGQNRMS